MAQPVKYKMSSTEGVISRTWRELNTNHAKRNIYNNKRFWYLFFNSFSIPEDKVVFNDFLLELGQQNLC